MQTLVEFVRYTKGWEYVIAIAAIFSSIFLWNLLMKEKPARKRAAAVARSADQAKGYPAQANRLMKAPRGS